VASKDADMLREIREFLRGDIRPTPGKPVRIAGTLSEIKRTAEIYHRQVPVAKVDLCALGTAGLRLFVAGQMSGRKINPRKDGGFTIHI
jgi:hypothetical protein